MARVRGQPFKKTDGEFDRVTFLLVWYDLRRQAGSFWDVCPLGSWARRLGYAWKEWRKEGRREGRTVMHGRNARGWRKEGRREGMEKRGREEGRRERGMEEGRKDRKEAWEEEEKR